ncbi:hypothetical protein H0H92_007602 [Tricholoma furcatifolium]|nr:hypothetical protein H0H92_007602 [Tricholoma furcatifolium]
MVILGDPQDRAQAGMMYRSSSYRTEEEDPYYNRSPSPDEYSRYGRPPDAWERTEPWGSAPAPWDDGAAAPSSRPRLDSLPEPRTFEPTQTSPIRPRRDSMLATRMFEPSDSWKSTHTDRTFRADNGRSSSNPSSYYSNPHNAYAVGDSYRPVDPHRDAYARGDSYRPGPSWFERRRRTSNTSPHMTGENTGRFIERSRRISGAGSVISSGSSRRQSRRRSRSNSPPGSSPSHSPSISRGRRSRSRERSRGNRSPSRGRSLVQQVSSTKSGSLFIAKKDISPIKYSWDRPTPLSDTNSDGNVAASSKALAPTQPLKSSWTRSASCSSIASTQPSDRASPYPRQISEAKPVDTSTRGEKIGYDNKQMSTSVDAEMSPVSIISSGLSKHVATSAEHHPQLSASENAFSSVSFSRLSASQPQAAGQPPLLLPSIGAVLDTQSKPNGVPIPALLPTTTEPEPNTQVENEIQADVRSKTVDSDRQALPHPVISVETPAEISQEKRDNVPAAVVESRRADTSATSLPTPLPTPQPIPATECPPSPPTSESIPTHAASFRDAMRIVVMTRILCDRQTRDERVNPVLETNRARATLNSQDICVSTPEEVVMEIMDGPRHLQKMERFAMIKESLVERLQKHQNVLTEKAELLKREYLALHERWLAHCAVLDGENKPAVEPEIVQPSGRTTRRSIANLGDAVRSDLEMEQIIASLGNDDATDPNYLSLRNLATIPDMISVTHGHVDYTFDDTNHYVENPSRYYGPLTGIDDWTVEEKAIFLDKFAAYPKQFGMIAEYLPNKTASQCVDYYYLHKKKIINFRKVVSQYAPNKRKRGRTGKKKSNALLADIRQHDAEVHGETELPKSSGRPSRGKKLLQVVEPKETKKAPPSRRRTQLDLTPSGGSATPTPEPEARRRGGRRSAVTPLSRTVSVSLEEAEDDTEDVAERPTKRARRSARRSLKSSAVVDDAESTHDVKTSEQTEYTGRRRLVPWTDGDKSLFMTLVAQHGDDFKRIAASMPNKTTMQVTNYFKTNYDELNLESLVAIAPRRSATPETLNAAHEVAPPTNGVSIPASKYLSKSTAQDSNIADQPMAFLALDPHSSYNNTATHITSTNRSSLTSNKAATPPHSNVSPTAARYPEFPSKSQALSIWPPPTSGEDVSPTSNGHARGYYPPDSRPAPYYPPHSHHHAMPPVYPPPAPYAYPSYHAPHYPPYDPRMHYSMPDSRNHVSTSPQRDDLYPNVTHSGRSAYHYSS